MEEIRKYPVGIQTFSETKLSVASTVSEPLVIGR